MFNRIYFSFKNIYVKCEIFFNFFIYYSSGFFYKLFQCSKVISNFIIFQIHGNISRVFKVFFGSGTLFLIICFGSNTAFANLPLLNYQSCISSEIFDIRTNENINGKLYFIKKSCSSISPKIVPSILQEHTGKGDDGKIRVQPNNSMGEVRKRFHRMKRPLPPSKEDKKDKEKIFRF